MEQRAKQRVSRQNSVHWAKSERGGIRMRFCDLLAKFDEEVRSRYLRRSDPRAADLQLILNIVKTMNRSLVLQEVLEEVLDAAICISGADRGFVLLVAPEGELDCVLARDRGRRTLDESAELFSHSVVEDVHATNEPVFVDTAQDHPQYDRQGRIIDLNLETILCSPLTVHEEGIGVIYVDGRSIQPVDKEEVVRAFEILAGQAAIAIKNAQLYELLQKTLHELDVANEQRMQSERYAIKGEIAAEISHELKNLLSVLLPRLQRLARALPRQSEDQVRSELGEILGVGKQIHQFAEGLMQTASLSTKKTIGDFNGAILDLLHFVQPLSKYRECTLIADLDSTIPAFAFDARQIQQVLLNLLSNAVEASREATICVRSRFEAEKQQVTLCVDDDGPGISSDVLGKLFTEKVTTKANGHGYGLPICKKIVEQHAGTLEVESTPTSGTSFTITLPVSSTVHSSRSRALVA